MTDNVTKIYEQSNNNVYNSINLEEKHVAKKLEIADRVECITRKVAYITLKNHKGICNINHKRRLGNQAKSELGKVVKSLWRISMKLSEKLHSNR